MDLGREMLNMKLSNNLFAKLELTGLWHRHCTNHIKFFNNVYNI